MSHLTITPELIVCRVEAIMSNLLANETIMMDADQGAYYGLNATGTRLWDLLAEPIAVSRLRDQLAADFAVSPQQCEPDMIAFMEKMVTRGLVKVVPDASC